MQGDTVQRRIHALGVTAVVVTLAVACGDGPTPPHRPEQHLGFIVQPSRVLVASVVIPSPRVELRDSLGQLSTTVTTIRLALFGHTTGAVLSGATARGTVGGVATFDDLRIDQPGYYRLGASAAGANALEILSDSFRVFPPYEQIASGGSHSCGATPAGVMYCWGHNGGGQLGIGNVDNSGEPKEGSLPSGIRFFAPTAGWYHSCALTSTGIAYCWGANSFNQLGDGSATARTTPTLVHAAGVSFVGISSGAYHSCAVTSVGDAYCWGSNGDGALGDGSSTIASTPVTVSRPSEVTFAQVSAGGGHTCALASSGSAYCWGENPYGGLGDGSTTARMAPVRVAAPSGVTFSSISVGDEHSCGLTAAGIAYCWGRNDVGQLGDGTSTSRTTPVPVAMPTGVTFARIDAGRLRTCGIAAAPISGTAYCWGSNDLRGLLGDGTIIDHPTPVTVAAPTGVTFAALDVGAEHTCAITPKGIAYCWGYDGYGQLGDGGGLTRMTPVLVLQ